MNDDAEFLTAGGTFFKSGWTGSISMQTALSGQDSFHTHCIVCSAWNVSIKKYVIKSPTAQNAFQAIPGLMQRL